MPDRPNILILMPDQLRADSLSCAGHPIVRTPSIDRLAAEGTRFANAYTSCPICMPARSSFLSGLYCHNHGQWANYGQLPADADTFAKRLQAVGYRTCHVGKSHYYSHVRDHLNDHLPFMHALGWQDVLETTGPLATRTTDSILTDRWRRLGCLELFREDYARRAANKGPALWPSPMPPGEHMDDFVGRTAVEYVEGYRRDEPLCLFVGFGGPHSPWDPPKDWADRYDSADMDEPLPPCEPPEWLPPVAAKHHRQMEKRPSPYTPEQAAAIRALYYAKVSHMDHWVGRILDAFEAAGALNETAVVFWSDHGEMLCDKGRTSKSVFFEGAARVPFIVRPPRGKGGPATCGRLVSLVDAFPTILDLAGCEPKADAFGRSLTPLLDDPRAEHHDAVFSEFDRRTMVRDERHKMVVDSRGETLKLYDLEDDPTESVNLVGRGGADDAVARLRDRLLRWHLATPSRQKA